MIQKKHILSIIFFSAVTGAVAQQDAMLSFRPFADMYNNPADLVYCRVWHATSQYRNSLHGFADGPKTYFFSFGGPIGIDKPTSSVTSRHAYTRRKEAQYGLGGYVIKDTYGHFGYTSYMLNYAQRFKLSRDYSFSIGLGAGLFDYFIESNKLNVKEI
ncbi:MAG: type IX secretion system membrane protein PorP/SprF, partial [Bacteroidales bacterium]